MCYTRTMKIAHPCIIMAGGQSRRMGEDKTLLPFGGYPTLVHYQMARLAPLFETIVISCKEPKFNDPTLPLLCDETSWDVSSPLVGLARALAHYPRGKVFIIGADTPFVSPETIQKLCHIEGHDAVIPKTPTKAHPLCAVYDSRILARIDQKLHRHDYKMMGLIAELDAVMVEGFDECEFANLNTPEEYHAACRSHPQEGHANLTLPNFQ